MRNSGLTNKNRFCSRRCVKEGYRLGIVVNPGNFKKGSVSLNKGRTLESWVGEDRAREIKERMSANSRNKAPQLRKLNDDPTIKARRLASRHFRVEVVLWLCNQVRARGARVFCFQSTSRRSESQMQQYSMVRDLWRSRLRRRKGGSQVMPRPRNAYRA